MLEELRSQQSVVTLVNELGRHDLRWQTCSGKVESKRKVAIGRECSILSKGGRGDEEMKERKRRVPERRGLSEGEEV